MEEKIVKSHKQEKVIKEVVIYPDHVERKESEEFRKSKERLKEDGHHKCWVCESTEQLEVHHFGCEWALANDCDYEKLKVFCEEFDPYGYGKLLKNKPMESPDDIRNMLVLCEKHHRHPEDGIHESTFPIWVIQKLAKAGIEPVPEE